MCLEQAFRFRVTVPLISSAAISLFVLPRFATRPLLPCRNVHFFVSGC
uniref:Uncharacterized protein n=1 Tax=Ciona intestinalis TaxID=7719 RepID=H2XTY1_CIOIN